MTIDEIMRAAPVIPVLVLEEEMDWAALAETFVAAGLPVLEVTLRTAAALGAIEAMVASTARSWARARSLTSASWAKRSTRGANSSFHPA